MTCTLRALSANDTTAIEHVRQFFRNYAAWLGVDLCFQNFEAEMASLPGAYAQPDGRLFYAERDGRPAGCVGIRPFSAGLCELKRLYVEPSQRSFGIGRVLTMAAENQAPSNRTDRAGTTRPISAVPIPATSAHIAAGFTPSRYR